MLLEWLGVVLRLAGSLRSVFRGRNRLLALARYAARKPPDSPRSRLATRRIWSSMHAPPQLLSSYREPFLSRVQPESHVFSLADVFRCPCVGPAGCGGDPKPCPSANHSVGVLTFTLGVLHALPAVNIHDDARADFRLGFRESARRDAGPQSGEI
jgi:hypothetical protein